MTRFDFLTSNRFWAIVIGAISIYLEVKGYIGEAERNLIATIMSGFVLVRTADKFGEQRIIAAGVQNGDVAASSVVKIPPQE